jgi:hypothetical protein
MNARRPKKAMARAIRCGEEDRVIVPAGKSKWLRGINKTYPPHDPEEVVALDLGAPNANLGSERLYEKLWPTMQRMDLPQW